jgi:apolipoprotein N-acyltransferase
MSGFKKHTMLTMAALSGLLIFLSFPKYGHGIVAWFSLVPLLLALKGAAPPQAFRIGFLTGMIAHVGILYWIVVVVVKYGYLPVYVGIGAMLLLAAYLSLYTGCFAMGVAWMRREARIAPLLSAPLMWAVLEYVRGNLLTGFPWESLAYSQYRWLKVIQVADVTGIYGISAAIVLVNVVLYDFLVRERSPRILLAETVTVLVLMSALIGYGQVRLKGLDRALAAAPSLDVALAQGNIDQNLKWNEAYQRETLDIYRSLSRTANLAPGGLIVWPETAAPFYFQRPEPLRESVVAIVREVKSALLFGSPSYEDRGGNRLYRNSAFLLGPDGAPAGRYDKMHLVPYGEYVPLRRAFPFIGKLVVGVGDFMPGDGYTVLDSGRSRLGVLICYEGIFPDAARNYKRGKADLLVNITNDAWFGDSSAPHQHLSMTVFRAVENRLPLVRAANTGISAIVDPRGAIRAQTPLFERTVLTGSIKMIDEKTFYAAYGDLFVTLCAASLLALCASTIRRRMRDVGRNSRDTA